eukprot:1363182-Pyramimonas_sp.AAC.1
MSVGGACDTQPLGPSSELLWGHETCEGCTEMGVGGACGIQPLELRRSSFGATKRVVRGVPECVWGRMWYSTTGTFGGAPNSLWGHQTCEGCAEITAGDACGTQPVGPSAGLLWDNKTCEGCADMSVGDVRGTQPLEPSAGLLWAHKTCDGRADMNVEAHVVLSLWDLRRSSYGVTKRAMRVLKLMRGAHVALSVWYLRRSS